MATRCRRGAYATAFAAFALALTLPAAGAAALDPTKLSFDQPVAVTQSRAYQAAEPSIRVDAPDPTHRIWIAAPSGIGINSRSLPAPGSENPCDQMTSAERMSGSHRLRCSEVPCAIRVGPRRF